LAAKDPAARAEEDIAWLTEICNMLRETESPPSEKWVLEPTPTTGLELAALLIELKPSLKDRQKRLPCAIKLHKPNGRK